MKFVDVSICYNLIMQRQFVDLQRKDQDQCLHISTGNRVNIIQIPTLATKCGISIDSLQSIVIDIHTNNVYLSSG